MAERLLNVQGPPGAGRGRPFQRTLPDPQPRPCEWCGTVFTPIRKKWRRRFCGLVCQRAYATSKRRSQAELNRLANVVIVKKYRGSGKPKTYVKYNGRHMHRVVMERLIGRPLTSNEIVHHKDHNPRNNRPENLEILTRAEHARHHFAEYRNRKGGDA